MKTRLNKLSASETGFSRHTRLGFATVAIALMSFSGQAQNSSYDADAIPVPGGSANSAFGLSSLASNTSGYNNSALGFYALYSNVTGGENTAGGVAALYSNNNGYDNCAIGVKCLASNISGNYNTAMGVAALASSDGDGNTGIGFFSLISNYQGKLNTGLGYYSDVASNGLTNATAIGNGAIALNSDELWLGDANTKVWTINSYNVSDGRFKTNVSSESVKGLEFIKLLRPVTYNFDAKKFTEFQTKKMPEERRKIYLDKDFSKTTAEVQTGFIAQEVEEAAKKSGYAFSGVHTPENADDAYGVSYYQFVVPLVKAVQEQQKMIEKQNQTIEALQQQISALSSQNNASNASGSISGINHIKGADGFSMAQNEPNPFTRETTVNYTIPQEVNNAYMAVYDLSGKQITTFAIHQKGTSSMVITSDKLSSGIYIYSIVADGKVVDSKRMIVADK